VLFHIAVCEQNLGRYVEALNDLGRAEELAQVSGDDSVLELVPDRRKEIESKISHLRVELLGPSEDARVLVDGLVISKTALRLDIPLNPGAHTVAVQQSGRPTVTRSLTLKAGGRHSERFDLTPAAPAAAAPVTAEYASGEMPEPESDPTVAKKVVIYSAYALALAGTGVGVYFLLDAQANQDTADLARADVLEAVRQVEMQGMMIPDGGECSPPFNLNNGMLDPRLDPCVELGGAIDNRDRSRTLATWSFVIAGVGALGGTAALLFWPDPEDKTALRVTPTLGGAILSGQF
jgi:hypothetical protein